MKSNGNGGKTTYYHPNDIREVPGLPTRVEPRLPRPLGERCLELFLSLPILQRVWRRQAQSGADVDDTSSLADLVRAHQRTDQDIASAENEQKTKFGKREYMEAFHIKY